MGRRAAGVFALALCLTVVMGVGLAAAQGCSRPACGPSADAGAATAPADSNEPRRESPFAAAASPSFLPAVSVVAGLLLLGSTLARVALRRRATLRAGIESDVEAEAEVEVVVRLPSTARASGAPEDAPAEAVTATGRSR